MGLEGAVTPGYRRELEAIADAAERSARFEQLVASMYEQGQAANGAIDPADSCHWLGDALPSE